VEEGRRRGGEVGWRYDLTADGWAIFSRTESYADLIKGIKDVAKLHETMLLLQMPFYILN